MARRAVFISYAREDRPQVEPSAELLRAGGVQVFIDVSGIDYGDRWQDVLRGALEQCERVMVFWSLAAKASEWVDREWRYALSLGKRIVPTLLDRTPLPDELQQFQALPRYRDVTVGAGAPSTRVPAVTRTALVAAVAVLVGAVWLWRPTQAPPPVASSSTPAPTVATRPAPPPTVAPAPAYSRVDRDLDIIRRAGKIGREPGRVADDLRRSESELAAILEDGHLGRYDAAELGRLGVAAGQALGQLRELKAPVAEGRGGFATQQELQAFEALLMQLETVSAQIRRTQQVAAAASAAAPASSTAPVLPPASSALPEPTALPGRSAAWWLAVVGAALAAALVLRRKRRREAHAAEAARFVDQVFAD
jgi:TIR domain